MAAEIRLVGRDRRGAERVALNTLRRRDGRAEVQEGIQVDLIEENPQAPSHHQVTSAAHPISKPDARRKIITIRREDRICVHPLNHKSLPRNEVGNVFAVAVERPEVFVAQTEIQVQSLGHLPTVLNVKVEGVRSDKPFRISDRDRGGLHVAGQKIGQSFGRRKLIVTRQGCARSRRRCRAAPGRSAPGPLRAVKDKLPGPATMIELVQMRLADFPSIAQLMASPDLRNDVR